MRTGSYDEWIGRDAYDRSGDRIGKIEDVFYDDVSKRPEWLSVSAGIFKGSRLVPIAGAQIVDDPDLDDDDDDDGIASRLVVAYDADAVKDAPNVDEHGHLSAAMERELYSHYGFDWGSKEADFGYGQAWNADRFDRDYSKRDVGAIGNVGVDRGTVEAEATIRNQEAKVVEGTETVRLRKYERTEMVPVTKEEVRVERVRNDKESRNA